MAVTWVRVEGMAKKIVLVATESILPRGEPGHNWRI